MTARRVIRGVGIVGLSGYEVDETRLARARHYFEARGHRVEVSPVTTQSRERFAGDDDTRLAAFRHFVEARDIDLVIGLRGGYGLSRLLPRLDWQALELAIKERGQLWVGHSDFTVLGLGALALGRSRTFAGPLAAPDFGASHIDPFTEEQFWRALALEDLEIEWSVEAPDLDVTGQLWGGNLAMLCSVVGTRFMPEIEGGILFLEDINEHPYRIERMLLQLEQTGVLGRQRAVLLGDFDGARTHEYDRGFDLDRAIDHVAQRSGAQLLRGLPFGHGVRKATLPLGNQARLTVVNQRVRLRLRGEVGR